MHLSCIFQLTSAAVSLQVALVYGDAQAEAPSSTWTQDQTHPASQAAQSNSPLQTAYGRHMDISKSISMYTPSNNVFPESVYGYAVNFPYAFGNPEVFGYPQVYFVPTSASIRPMDPPNQPIYSPNQPMPNSASVYPATPPNFPNQPLPQLSSVYNPPKRASCFVQGKNDVHNHVVLYCPDHPDINFLVVGNLDRCTSTLATDSIVSQIRKLINAKSKPDSPQFVISVNAKSISNVMCRQQDIWSELWADHSIPWISAIGDAEERSNQEVYSKSKPNWIMFPNTFVVDVNLSNSNIRLIVLDPTEEKENALSRVAALVQDDHIDKSIIVNYNDIYNVQQKTSDPYLLKLKNLISAKTSKTLAYISSQDSGLQYLHKSHVDYIVSGGATPDLIQLKKVMIKDQHVYKYRSEHGFFQYKFEPANGIRTMKTYAYLENGIGIEVMTETHQHK